MPAHSGIARLVALVTVTMLVAGTSAAQTKVGTTFGAFTLIEPDARLAAMGNAGTASAEGLAGAFHNAAAAAGGQKRAGWWCGGSALVGTASPWAEHKGRCAECHRRRRHRLRHSPLAATSASPASQCRSSQDSAGCSADTGQGR